MRMTDAYYYPERVLHSHVPVVSSTCVVRVRCTIKYACVGAASMSSAMLLFSLVHTDIAPAVKRA